MWRSQNRMPALLARRFPFLSLSCLEAQAEREKKIRRQAGRQKNRRLAIF
jgi:hypothetical protein